MKGDERDDQKPCKYCRYVVGSEREVALDRLLDGEIGMEEYRRIVDMYKFRVE